MSSSECNQSLFFPSSGDSPFSKHDVTSRSALIGVPEKGHMAAGMYWNKRNPNAVSKKTGNRRKKTPI